MENRELKRRKYERVPAIGVVSLEGSGRDYHGYVVNLSEGGLRLKGQELPDANSVVTMMFQIPPYPYLYQLEAEVVWISHSSDEYFPREMGVKFTHLGQEDRNHIREYMDSHGNG